MGTDLTIAIALGAATVYFGGRLLIEGGADQATRNAERILDIERSLGIDVEQGAQDAVLGSDVLRAIGNLSYV